MSNYEFVEGKNIDMYHFKMYQGKFLDKTQLINDEHVYIYANISDFDTNTFEESEVRVYAHPYEKLCCAEDYEITRNLYDEDLSYLKTVLLEMYKKSVM